MAPQHKTGTPSTTDTVTTDTSQQSRIHSRRRILSTTSTILSLGLLTPTSATTTSQKQISPETRTPTVAPGTTVHFELFSPTADDDTSVSGEWWIDNTLITDQQLSVAHDLLFPPNREYFHYQFDDPGTYTVEGALLRADANTTGEADIPPDQRATWTITVADGGNQAPYISPRTPAESMTVAADSSFTLEANVIDWDGELARMHWRYRFGDVYLGSTNLAGVYDVASLTVDASTLYEGGFEVFAVNTTGALSSIVLWDVDSPTHDPDQHTIRAVCDHTIHGTDTDDACD